MNIISIQSRWRTTEKFRILIVEDNDFYRKLLGNHLQNSFPKIEIDEAVDGHDALQKVDSFLPDLIFMDIRLPDKNGLELTKEIRATHPNMHIIILTYYDFPEYGKAAFQNGADNFLAKSSLDLKELEELVKSYQQTPADLKS